MIAYIGMGLLGSALAANLIKAGYTVRGFDIAPERMREHEGRGGVPARSPADAARGATVVMTCLMTADLVREVLLGPDGAIDAAPPGVARDRQQHDPPRRLRRAGRPARGSAGSRCWTRRSRDRAGRRAGARRR